MVTISVLLDAKDLPGQFFAWAGYRFNAELINARDESVTIPADAVTVPTESPIQVAPSESPFGPQGGTDNFIGRRPGFQAFSSNVNGGSRSAIGAASQVVATPDGGAEISNETGFIAGFQQPFTSPGNNFGINIDRDYEAFRFRYQHDSDFGIVGVRFTFLELYVYPTEDSLQPVALGNFLGFGTDFRIDPQSPDLNLFVIPAPASAAVLLTAPLLATRRRR